MSNDNTITHSDLITSVPYLHAFIALRPEMAGQYDKTNHHFTARLDKDIVEEAEQMGGLMFIDGKRIAIAIPVSVSLRIGVELYGSLRTVGMNGLDDENEPIETATHLIYSGTLD